MSGKFFVRNNFRAARFIFPFMSFVVATLFALPLHAADVSWSVLPPQTGDWQTAANWSSLALPGSGDAVYVVNGGTVTVSGLTQSCANLFFGAAGGSGNLQMTGGSLGSPNNEPNEYVGTPGVGSFTQSGGINGPGNLEIGGLWNSGGTLLGGSGTYSLSGSGILYANGEGVGSYNTSGVVGSSGTGSFTQSGGTNSIAGGLSVDGIGGSAYNLSGGYLNTFGPTYIGYYGTGSFNQSGGTFSYSGGANAGTIYLGRYNSGSISSSGTYGLSGGSLYSSQENVGYEGTGSFIQSGGTNSIKISLVLGYYGNTSGTYYLSGNGILSVGPGGSEFIGYSGVGNFTQSGGANIVGINNEAGQFGSLYIGGERGNTYNLIGGSLSCGAESVSASGTFTQSGGTNSVYYGRLGLNIDFGSTYNLNGGYINGGINLLSGSGNWPCNQYVGDTSTGTFTQTGGTNSVLNLELGISKTGSGTYNLDGGLLSLVNEQGGLSAAIYAGSGNAAFNFNGGTLQAGPGFSCSLSMTLGTSGGGATFNTAGNTMTLFGSLFGTGGLTKVGSGTLLLAATNTYSGNTLIDGGTLALGSPLALQQSTLDTSGSGSLSFGTLTSATFGGLTGPGALKLANSSAAAVALSVGNNGASTTFAGTLLGSGSLSKIGSGSLTLTDSNTYSGTTTVHAGVLEFANPASLPGYTTSGKVTVASGATLAVQLGSGTLGWSNSQLNTLLTATAWSSAGSILGIDTSNGSATYGGTINPSIGLTKFGYNALTLASNNSYSGPTFINGGSLILESGLPSSSVAMSSNTTLDLSAGTAGQVNFGSLADAAGSPTGHQVLLGDNTLVTGLDSTSTTFSGAISGNGGLIKAGSGTFTLAGSNTYGGGTTIAAGELALAGSAALPPNGSISFTGGAPQAIDSTDYSARFSTAPGQAYALDTNGQNVTWATALNSSGGSLTKLGAGMLTLTNSNTYSGTTTVNAGTLQLGNGMPGHDVALAGNIVNNASLVCNLNGSETSSGIISGIGNLVKSGPGDLIMTASNTYYGATTISAGTLQLGDGTAGHDGTLAGNIVNNFVLAYDLNGNQTYLGSISGSGSVTKMGRDTLTLAGNNSYSGPTFINGGSLIFESGLPSSSVVMSSNTTLDVSLGTANPVGLALWPMRPDRRPATRFCWVATR